MRIAFICTEMSPVPSIRGGAIQIFIDGVAPYLSGKHDLTIFCIADPNQADREEVDGVTYIRIPRKKYVTGVAKELAKQHSTKQAYQVIHVFNRPENILKYKTATPSSNFIISCHNEMFRKERVSDEMGELSIRLVDKIMLISDYIGSTIVQRFPSAASKMHTIYSGVNLRRYKPIWQDSIQSERKKLRKKYGVNNKKVILFVGRLCKAKGTDILITAMKKVIQSHPNAVLVIVGSKSFRDHRVNDYVVNLRQLAESLGKNRVIFTNFVPPSEMPSLFLLGDIFVCSSQWQEPLARVHYEAMGAGLPIITTNRGGNAEIIRHNKNGIVLNDYSNPQAFADSISNLLSNPEKALKLAKAGRRFVEKDFGFEHVAKRLENLYLSIKDE
ncbi:glycosyltransferase family 4 protein [Paenibacillus sedimenti]|uniref:Glycosyltransferase family 4 protein n=1 Tax=Paenibacillus sedimenti TaxID=2770274 RepID=A0A926KPE4_9BACL|nr:glycosyltransferase family 4 protein [Paenibacillus sedimenti]MBD0381574.1 glycosyltransferase family 4 protein [Paenibacillus sedimenti]